MEISSYTAIDFETAIGKRNSICQVGLVRVERGVVIDKLNILVQPPNNEYFYRNTQIHGITAEDTFNSPTFDMVWSKVKPFIENQNVVAHNGAFDYSCLKQTLEYYNIEVPYYTQHCTLKIYNKNLATLCQEHNIPLNHHDALSDAMACAKLFHKYLVQNN